MYLQSVFRHCILERYVLLCFQVGVSNEALKNNMVRSGTTTTCVMRKERGPNTSISFPTHKREKGHNNQGRKYLL